jgi:GGDEF domain-containing protein
MCIRDSPWHEVVGQVLLVMVLAAAMHWGRRGGFAAAAFASLAYVALLMPSLVAGPSGFGDFGAILLRVLAFGVLGIVGGEVSVRMRYALSELDGQRATDGLSGVFTRQFGAHRLAMARERLHRYDEEYSVVLVTLVPEVATDKVGRTRPAIRVTADCIRGDVRMVDEVSYLDDGRFLVLLPHTSRANAGIVSDRLAASVRAALEVPASAVTAAFLGGREDARAVEALLERLEEGDAHLPSGSYSSGASRTAIPASRRASVAPGASTFRTSTAAFPDGSTKQ